MAKSKNHPLERLKYHISGAIERGETQAIECIPATIPTLWERKRKMRFGKKTIQEAETVKSKFNLGEKFGLCLDIREAVRLAKEHHSIQEAKCCYEISTARITREKNIENRITTIAEQYDLGVHFDGDPRGFTVKLHAKDNSVWNTWGGAETGYGIGLK